MRLILSIFFGSFMFMANGQEINKYDDKGERHGIWKKMYPGTTQLRYEGQFEHGREVGTFKYYCEECGNKPTAVKEFNDLNNEALVRYYTMKGKLVSEGKMLGKKRIGEWLYFQERSNDVMTRENYVDGKLHGKKITYYTNGQITEELNFENGMAQGENIYYAPDGVVLKRLQYVDDELHGNAKYYNAKGDLIIDGNYKAGKKHGTWKHYQDGVVVKVESFPKPIKREN